MLDIKHCHCGSDNTFENCCQPILIGASLAITAEQLMRSRFVAYKLQNYAYLIETSENPPANEDKYDSNIDWLGLRILATENGKARDLVGHVEFVAFYQDKNPSNNRSYKQLHEKSYFEIHGKRWCYINGSILTPVKIARNERCFCSSRLKVKKCHGVSHRSNDKT